MVVLVSRTHREQFRYSLQGAARLSSQDQTSDGGTGVRSQDYAPTAALLPNCAQIVPLITIEGHYPCALSRHKRRA